MSDKILFVDDDPRLLASCERNLRKHFSIVTAEGPQEGLRLLDQADEFAVVVSDMRMPGMNGVEFLAEVQKLCPMTVRLILTGQADQNTTIAAVNQGNLFRFLLKPCSIPELTRAISAGLRQYQLQRSERDLLEKTVAGAVEVLAEVLALVSPSALGRSKALQTRVQRVAAELGLESSWSLDVAANLSQIGSVTLPESLTEKAYHGRPLDAVEREQFSQRTEVGANLLRRIPRLEEASQIVALQDSSWKDLSETQPPLSPSILWGASILKAVNSYETFKAFGRERASILEELKGASDEFRPEVVDAMGRLEEETVWYEPAQVLAKDLVPGMILAQDLRTRSGILLISRGQDVSETLCIRLTNFSDSLGVDRGWIQVFRPIVSE
ncbi:MAG: response regulator [Planctomycetota bacterium]